MKLDREVKNILIVLPISAVAGYILGSIMRAMGVVIGG